MSAMIIIEPKGTQSREGWPRGPWDAEPDKVQWKDEATGLDCLAVRASGHWCGYVGVPEGHRLFGLDYTDDALDHVSVHGGLTFADHCGGRICHVREEGEPEVFWFGFDCAHDGDYSPNHRWSQSEWGGSYRDLDYVRSECRSLAEQIAAIGPRLTE